MLVVVAGLARVGGGAALCELPQADNVIDMLATAATTVV
jgi:hypothetical protein